MNLSLSPNRIILLAFVVISFYAGLILYFDFTKIFLTYQNFNISFIPLIFTLVLSSLFLRSIIQYIFLKQIGINIPFKENILLFSSSFSMMVTPGGIGMLIKSYFLKKKYNYTISKTLPVVLFERLNDLTVIMCIISIFSIFYFKFEISLVIFFGFLIIILILIFLKTKKFTKILKFLEQKISFLKLDKLDANEFDNSVNTLLKPSPMTKSLSLNFIATSLDGIAVLLCFQAFGATFNHLQIIQSYFTSIFFGAVSFIPGGLGIVEGSFIGLLVLQGFESSFATSIVIFVRLFLFWLGVSIGFVIAYSFLNNNSK